MTFQIRGLMNSFIFLFNFFSLEYFALLYKTSIDIMKIRLTNIYFQLLHLCVDFIEVIRNVESEGKIFKDTTHMVFLSRFFIKYHIMNV